MHSGNCHEVTEIRISPAEAIGPEKTTYTRHIIIKNKDGQTFDLTCFGVTLDALAVKF